MTSFHTRILLLAACWLATAPAALHAQDTLRAALPEVRIEAARGLATAATAPFAVAMRNRSPEGVALTASASLSDVLSGLPGLWADARGHRALGDRLVIRGAGARAAFGVRGRALGLDGLPQTLPDGQAVTEVVDPLFVRRAEVLRGPAARFWGNGSGGAVFLSTLPPPDAPPRFRAEAGAYGMRRLAAEAGVGDRTRGAWVQASDLREDGFRAHAGARLTRAALHAALPLGPRTRLGLHAHAVDQDVRHPGSLTAEEMAADPRAADARYVRTASGKRSRQLQLAGTVRHATARGLLAATVYGLHRSLDNPLPFAYIALGRNAGGGRLTFEQSFAFLDWSTGFDAGIQRDDRRNFDNAGGSPGPDVTLDQLETVRAAAAFATLSARLTEALRLHGALRYDRVHFALDDRRGPSGSPRRAFGAWSPALGLTLAFSPDHLLFLSYATAFETPTTTELVNRPDGADGFNPALSPERTRSLEGGARGRVGRLSYDLALYARRVEGLLLPFQAEDGDGRTFYRNAGDGRDGGVELSATVAALPWLSVRGAYSGIRANFTGGALDGNALPGLPPHRLHLTLTAHPGRFYARARLAAASGYHADDANTARTEAYTVVDLSVGHTGLRFGRLRAAPLGAIDNLLDARYAGSVVVNARGGRFFEPAPGRALTVGLNISFE